MVHDQVITDNYAIYNSDCMEVLPTLPDKSIDLSVYSPPFAGLYNYSSSERDFSNCDSREQFMEMYEFLIKEIGRVTKDGRISAVHVMEIVSRNGAYWDFPNAVIESHARHGFEYKGRITIWKEPLQVRLRTMLKSLTHQTLVEDATECFPATPDYLLLFRKKGVCEKPVTHAKGLKRYYGAIPILPDTTTFLDNSETENYIELSNTVLRRLQKQFEHYEGDHKGNILSHVIYRRYMSSVWDDIRIDEVLPFQESKDEDDEKHVHPLQLDVIDRVVELYSNPNDTVLTPFMGVGSEVFSAVSQGRKAIGIELKESYFRQAIMNLEKVGERFKEYQLSLF
jgi:DNA modification methylase